jgi:hypothetical protein
MLDPTTVMLNLEDEATVVPAVMTMLVWRWSWK